MIAGVRQSEFKSFQVYARAEREAGHFGRAGGFQFVGAAEVIAGGDVEIVSRQDVQTHNEMVEQFRAEFYFLGVGIGQGVIIRLPARHVGKCRMDAHGQVVETF